MFLKNIRLANFKCLDSLVMDFNAGKDAGGKVRNISFIVGGNDTGKSSLLQAIALITGGSGVLRSMPGTPDDYIQHRKRFCELEAGIASPDGTTQVLRLRLERGQSFAEAAILNNGMPDTSMDRFRKSYSGYFVAGYGPGRLAEEGASSSSRSSARKAGFPDVQSLFGKQRLLGPGDLAPDDRSLPIIKRIFNSMLPQDVRVKAWDKDGGLLFSTPDGVMPLHSLGSGCRQMLGWLGDLLCRLVLRAGDAKNPFAAGGLLLIDDLDLHLHPSWQRRLHASLHATLPNFQIIATASSPLTAQQARPDELYALRRNELNRIELLPFIGDPSWMLLHQMLMSPMFGLESDESLRVETAKALVRANALAGKKPTAGPARSATESVIRDLPLKVNVRPNSGAEPEDLSLLQQINASLLGKKRKP